ncbi:MAG: ECF-type sigma factor [Planctomycetota bacterium]
MTKLIELVAAGDAEASNALFVVLYEELRWMAKNQMQRENPGNTLECTALVHEAWIKLVGSNQQIGWTNRQHFFATAAQAMRRILVDAARARRRQKRGGDMNRCELGSEDAVWQQDEELLELDEALLLLEQHDEQKALLVKLRYFAGLTNAQVAEQLQISTATAERYWVYAKAWLRSKMQCSDGE